MLRNVGQPKYYTVFSKPKTRSLARCSMGALQNPGSPRTADSTLLTLEERNIFRQGRNNKVFSSPKHASIGEYRATTGFECLVCYLYLCKQVNRFEELMLKSEVVEYLEQSFLQITTQMEVQHKDTYIIYMQYKSTIIHQIYCFIIEYCIFLFCSNSVS